MSTELYLVTGGCGFIGSHLCEELLKQGHRVRVLDDLSSGYRKNLQHLAEVEILIGDVRDPLTVGKAVAGAKGVFHEAALVSVFDSVKRPGDTHDINTTGTLNVLMAAREAGVQRVLFAGTAASYGNDPTLPKREDLQPQPESPYAVAKVASEHYLRIFHSLYGLESITVRYFNVFGPRQDPRSPYSGVISKFVDDLESGRAPTIFGDGLQSRDFVFVKDVVQANMLAMFGSVRAQGQIYNVASGRTARLLDLLKVMGELTGKVIQPVHKEARVGDIRHSAADISRAQKELGYAPKFDLKTGLKELLASL